MMTQIAAQASARGYTPSGLRTRVRALHKPTVALLNAGLLSVAAAVALSVVGIVAIGTTESGYGMRQLVYLVVALTAGIVVVIPPYRWLRRLSYPLMALVMAMLVFVLIPAVPDWIVRPRNGARRWISLFVTDFQPSELAKIAYVLALASYLRFRDNYRRFRGLLLLLTLTFIPMGLILLEPDLGTALLFLPTLFAMVIAAGAKLRHIVLIILLGLCAAPAMYPLLRPHQQDRIKALFAQVKGDPRYENDIGYQGARAMTLAGAGGWLGVGSEKAADLIRYNHLPEDHNDMVFAVISCRWGLLGAFATWAVFGLFCIGGLMTAVASKEPSARLAAVGITALIFTQMAINTGMVVGLLPITGITLPFISYGGSSLVTTWIMVGLLYNVSMHRSRQLAKAPFEFDGRDDH